MFKKSFSSFLPLLLIFCISLFLRTYKLGTVPYGLHNDEMANTYVGRYILLNGEDLYGNKWPLLYFDKFGDYPPVLPMYISGLGTFILGNNEWGSRILIALIGSIIVFPVYWLALEIFKNKKTALFASLMAAIAPWHIVLSRVNSENVIAVTLFVFGLVGWTRGFAKKTLVLILISFLAFILTYFLYPSFRIIIPLSLLPTIFFLQKEILSDKKLFFSWLILMLMSFVLTLYISSTGWGKGRFDQTSIFNAVSGVNIRTQELIFNESNIFVARVFNNKVIGFFREFLVQYSKYFSPLFLFIQGGLPLVYSVPNNGLLYMGMLILILISAALPKDKKINNNLFLQSIYLLFVTAIPSALTVIDTPNVHRSLPMFIFVIILSSYGFHNLRELKLKKFPIVILPLCLLFLEFIYFAHFYFQHASTSQSIWRNDGNKQLVEYILKNKDKYKSIYMTHEERWLPIYYLFYKNDYDKKYAGKFGLDFKIDKIDNLIFSDSSCPSDWINSNIISKSESLISYKDNLIADKSGCWRPGTEPKFLKAMGEIKRINKTSIFYLSEVKTP